MPKRPKHLSVTWYFLKKPFIYTTKAAFDLLAVLSEMTKTHTPNEIITLINYDTDAKKVMQMLIDKGYGDEPLIIH